MRGKKEKKDSDSKDGKNCEKSNTNGNNQIGLMHL